MKEFAAQLLDQFQRNRRHRERERQIIIARVSWEILRFEEQPSEIQRDYSEEREFGWALDTEDQRRSH